MANPLGVTLQQRLPVWAGTCHCSYFTAVTTTSAVNSVSSLSKVLNKWKSTGGRAPRRLVLRLGASFWSQFMSMAGAVGAKSFITSARQKVTVEEILKNVEWPEQFPFKEEDFQRFDE